MKRRRYITSAQLANALGVSTRTIARWLSAEKLPRPRRTEGRCARWPIAIARAEVERRGFEVPEEWTS